MLGVASVALRATGCTWAKPPQPPPEPRSLWSFDETSQTDGVFDDLGPADVPMTMVGTWTDLTTASMVQAIGGTSAYTDGSGYARIAANVPAHGLSALTISFYYQRNSATAQQVLLAAGDGTQRGDFSIEVLADGKLRGWHTGQDDVRRFFENGDGITGTNLQVGTAYRIDLSLGPQGARIYLDGSELAAAAIPANRNSWSNARAKYLGRWTDGIQSPADGAFDRLRLWNGQLTSAEIALLEPARSIALPSGDTSSIVLAPTVMWIEYEPAADGAVTGLSRITDTAIGGSIQSSSGGTLPAFPLTVDPTPFVSGASGSKTTWVIQFQASTLGTWTKLGNGDLQFTPGTTPGLDESQYRVSDDGGSTFSPWADLKTRVLDRSLCPGPYFLVEDYGGSNQAKLQAAREAAVAAGGGTVTTLDRGTVLTDICDHAFEPEVGYLFLNLKRPDARHGPTGDFCTATGNDERSGWTPDESRPILNGQTKSRAIVRSGARINIVGCVLDNNSLKQALHQTSGDNATPNSNYGTCWPGTRRGHDFFNMQFNPCVKLQGLKTGDPADRQLFGAHGCILKYSTSDGIRGVGSVDIISTDNIMTACARGHYVVDGGNSKLRATRTMIIPDPEGIGGGIDHEMLTFGDSRFGDFIHEDDVIGPDFDVVIRGDSRYLFNGCDIGPGLNLAAKTATAAIMTFQGSAANPRGRIRYHAPSGGLPGTSFPRSALIGWTGQAPHVCTYRFMDQDFITHGAPYVFNANPRIPAAGHTWRITLGQTVNTSDAWRVELINCQALVGPDMPAGSVTLLLFETVKALTTTQVLRIDGLTIASGFERDAIRLDGQRLEYRNVTHQGFPSATIQQICPGAGQYVAL